MGPRFSTLYESSTRSRQSPIAEVQPSAVQVESKISYESGRYAWTSASQRHVALLDTIREKASRTRRTASKPTVTGGGQLGPSATASAAAEKRVWAKLIARLSRKMGATRLGASRSASQQVPDSGVELHQGPGAPGTHGVRGTSSVLPISRNAVTTTLAYNDNTKQPFNDNNNVPPDDFASRVSAALPTQFYKF